MEYSFYFSMIYFEKVGMVLKDFFFFFIKYVYLIFGRRVLFIVRIWMVKGFLRGLKLRIFFNVVEELLYFKILFLYVMFCFKVDKVKLLFRMYVLLVVLMVRKFLLFLDFFWFRCFILMFVVLVGIVTILWYLGL